MERRQRAIPAERDRMQSSVLTWAVGLGLGAACLPLILLMIHPHDTGSYALRAGIVSLTFGVIVWVLRAATPMAALCGGMICLLVTMATENPGRWAEVRSGLAPLMALFVLTFLATKAGRVRKMRAGLAESRRGRNAAQIVANLGAAGLVAMGAAWLPVGLVEAMLLGVLAEATADTVSSEIGQAFGGAPILLTTFRRVEAGVDGAVSVVGTFVGVLGACFVALVGVRAMHTGWRIGLAGALGGVAGLFFDSVLGATVERRGWLGNDLVNFSSTVVGGLAALGVYCM